MFRIICNSVKNPFKLPVFANYCASYPVQRRPRDINEVRIAGTLIKDSFALDSGTKALTVHTQDSPTTHSYHTVHLKTRENFLSGQRVSVLGVLRSQPMTSHDGKLYQCTLIKAFTALENECASTGSNECDENHIQLFANVACDLVNKDTYCTFAVATHYKTGESEQKEVNFHRIFVYDLALRNYLKDNLNKSDRVLLTGKLNYHVHKKPDGKRFRTGFVVADSVRKVVRDVEEVELIEKM